MTDSGALGKLLIAQFDGTNFNNWTFRMEILLDEKELLQFVKKDVKSMVEFKSTDTQSEKKAKEETLMELMKRDKMCKRYIIKRISDSHLESVKDKDTAFDIMQSLEMTYQKRGLGSRMLLRRTLWNLKYNSSSEKK